MDFKGPYESNVLPTGFSYAGGSMPVDPHQSSSSQNLGINSSATTSVSKFKTKSGSGKVKSSAQFDFETLRQKLMMKKQKEMKSPHIQFMQEASKQLKRKKLKQARAGKKDQSPKTSIPRNTPV